jgi:hypothetical protein
MIRALLVVLVVIVVLSVMGVSVAETILAHLFDLLDPLPLDWLRELIGV